MSTKNNMALTRLFTKPVITALITNFTHDVYKDVVTRYLDNTSCNITSNKEAIAYLYDYMGKYYRNEYFYQNTLLNKLLLGRHSLNTTVALSQVPIERSKADFILINGKAVVYEIKTELDTFDRLETQLRNYYTAFNHVCVVTCEKNFNRLNNILKDTPIGIYVLTTKETLQLKKSPVECSDYLDHNSLFKILRKYEYENILLKHFGYLPEVTPVFQYDASSKMFAEIPLLSAYAYFLAELKQRNKIEDQHKFSDVPYELKSLMYFSNLKSSQYQQVNRFLNKPYEEATRCIIHM